MRVVDTSAWIEWLTDGPIADQLAKLVPELGQCVVPTIVQLELAKWLGRERGEDEVNAMIAYTQKCLVVALDTPIALMAAECCSRFKLATADAIVYATALGLSADLLTCDAHFEGLDGVVYMPKARV